MTDPIQRTFRPALPPTEHGHPGFGYRREDRDNVIVERDVAIPIRGDLTLYGDLYRPAGSELVPVIVCYAPFGKHPHIDWNDRFAGSDVPVDRIDPETPFEVFDPYRWSGEGFAILTVDGVGNWYSEGTPKFLDVKQEGEAGYDIVEWAAEQPWCNGNVGWGAVSYYAMTAWSVGALNPPHLKAIYAHDAASDNYRETNFRGGIPTQPLTHNWMLLTGIGLGEVEDMEAGTFEHPMNDAFWQSRVADWSSVRVPVFAATEWGNDLHSRGTIEAWKHLASEVKFLDVTGGKEWAEFYSERGFERQRAFLGEYLRGEDNGVASWPPVRLGVRDGGRDWVFRDESQWPPARTEYRTLHLDASAGELRDTAAAEPATVAYESTDEDARATFDFTVTETTEITGNTKVRLWVSTDTTNDADLFVGFEHLDRDGQVIPYVFSQMYNDGPVAFGWLRASHRELDEARSTPQQPIHLHQRRQYLVHRTPVAVDIEVWPTSLVLRPGETLRLVVQGSDLHKAPGSPMASRMGPLINDGHHTIHTGGAYDSHLLIPVIPATDEE